MPGVIMKKPMLVRFRSIMLLALFAIITTSSACVSLQTAYLTNVSAPVTSATPIEAEASKLAIFGIIVSNDFAYEAAADLVKQCPQGTVTGILSTYEKYYYLVAVSHVVKVRGYCVQQ